MTSFDQLTCIVHHFLIILVIVEEEEEKVDDIVHLSTHQQDHSMSGDSMIDFFSYFYYLKFNMPMKRLFASFYPIALPS